MTPALIGFGENVGDVATFATLFSGPETAYQSSRTSESRASLGNSVMMRRTTDAAMQYTQMALASSSSVILAMTQVTNRHRPTGGVKRPMGT